MSNLRGMTRQIVALGVVAAWLHTVGSMLSQNTIPSAGTESAAIRFDALQALYVAETGIAQAVHEINAGNLAAFVESDQGTRELAGTYMTHENGRLVEIGPFRVRCDELAPGKRAKLISTGEFKGIRRAVRVVVELPGSLCDVSVAAFPHGAVDANASNSPADFGRTKPQCKILRMCEVDTN